MMLNTDGFPWSYPPVVNDRVFTEMRIVIEVNRKLAPTVFNHVHKFYPSLLKFYEQDGQIPDLAMKIADVWARGLADIDIENVMFDYSYFAQARRRDRWFRREWKALWGNVSMEEFLDDESE